MLAFAAAVGATVLAMLLGLVFLLARRAAHGAIAPPRTLTQHIIYAANLTFPEKLGAASKRAGQVAARFLAKRNKADLHFLISEKEINELVWLLRASGIRVLHDMDVKTLVEIHLEVHKDTRAAMMVARANRNLAGTGAHDADLEYPMSIAPDVVAETMATHIAAEGDQEMTPGTGQPPADYPGGVAASPKEQSSWSSTKSAPIDHAPLKNPPEGAPIAEGQPVTHKPRTMSEAADRRKLLVGVDPEGKPSYVPGWAVKHAAARARGISSGVVGTAASSGNISE
jgi:hypothetical protein